jgi:hypothetical protein
MAASGRTSATFGDSALDASIAGCVDVGQIVCCLFVLPFKDVQRGRRIVQTSEHGSFPSRCDVKRQQIANAVPEPALRSVLARMTLFSLLFSPCNLYISNNAVDCRWPRVGG